VGWVPTLLYQSSGAIPLSAGISQTHLRVLTNGEYIFDTVNFVPIAPKLTPGRTNLDEEPALIA
jgi:hypothetical protein